ncbi:fructosyl amino acid oxidase [Purpureocillium lilacinum]|uniref:Fructosyl amino acid oxidase n=1 Tax=Purpureocillium lilacinum TaxID=33203 RepID=A0A2U3E8K1_PURLI|nr:fructosyl amino acid oxidase [Purpureocillium lilacinum]
MLTTNNDSALSGVLGISTAFHLAKRGYTNITSIDKHLVPSPDSAGNDLNKIIRAEYEEPLYAEMAVEAMAAWKDPYWGAGRLTTTSGDVEYEENLRLSYENLQRLGHADAIELINGRDAVVKHCPILSASPVIDTWKGQWNSQAGWAHSRAAMERWAAEARAMGVTFLSGTAATMTGLETAENGQLIGIKVESGDVLSADRYILCAGAASSRLLPDLLSPVLRPVCTLVGNLELTDDEYSQWKGIPVIDNLELGYAFEPEHETRRMKIGGAHRYGRRTATDERMDHTWNTDNGTANFASAGDNGGGMVKVPKEALEGLRRFISAVMPGLAGKPLVGARLCWDADTPDGHFLIDKSPRHAKLLIASGGSQHAFKMFPVIGGYIADALEGRKRGLRPEWRLGPRSESRDAMWPDDEIKNIEDVEMVIV